MSEETVRVKRSDLQALIDANTEAYNLLDEITTPVTDVEEKVKKAFNVLSEAPSSIDEIIVEEDDEEEQPDTKEE